MARAGVTAYAISDADRRLFGGTQRVPDNTAWLCRSGSVERKTATAATQDRIDGTQQTTNWLSSVSSIACS